MTANGDDSGNNNINTRRLERRRRGTTQASRSTHIL